MYLNFNSNYMCVYRFSDSDIDYLKTLLTHAEEEYWIWLRSVDCSRIKVYAMNQGEVQIAIIMNLVNI